MHPELLLLIGISLSLGFTPGPNNAVAAYSGFNFGIRKTLPLILGVGFGYTTLIILINFVLISTFKNYPIIQEIIRVLGTIFLIYLAYKISFSKISSDGKTENPVKFFDKFIIPLQWQSFGTHQNPICLYARSWGSFSRSKLFDRRNFLI